MTLTANKELRQAMNSSQINPRCLDNIKSGGLEKHFINEIMNDVSY
jgi:hypothetical protein